MSTQSAQPESVATNAQEPSAISIFGEKFLEKALAVWLEKLAATHDSPIDFARQSIVGAMAITEIFNASADYSDASKGFLSEWGAWLEKHPEANAQFFVQAQERDKPTQTTPTNVQGLS